MVCSGLGQGNEGTLKVISPGTPRGSRLVASTDMDGLAARRPATSAAQPTMRCSQLSNTSSDGWSPSSAASWWIEEAPGVSRTPMAASAARPTASGSDSGASSTHHTPPGCESTVSAATARARRVLPTPAEPVRVTRRSVPSRPRTSAISLVRPISGVSWTGRLCRNTSRVRSEGNVDGRSGWTTCQMCSGRARSWSRCWPKSTQRGVGREPVSDQRRSRR